MQIEIFIDGEKKTFIAPVVPMLAKRKFLEIEATAEERERVPTAREQLEEENELAAILADVVFGGQFTAEQLYSGVSDEYFYSKLREACFGKPEESKEGNEKGE